MANNKRNNYNKYYKKTETESVPENVSFENKDDVKVEEVEEAVKVEEVVKEEKFVGGKVVDCTRLRVRKAPLADADIESEIPLGTNVIVNKEESTDDFYSVEIPKDNLKGYCMKKYIKIV